MLVFVGPRGLAATAVGANKLLLIIIILNHGQDNG